MAHSSSGHKHALTEVMQDPSVQAKLSDTKSAKEVQALDNFYEMMNVNPDRAYYGYQEVSKANDRGAIDTLLVTDELFRSADISERKKYVSLVEHVRDQHGQVYVFSSMHPSGERKVFYIVLIKCTNRLFRIKSIDWCCCYIKLSIT